VLPIIVVVEISLQLHQALLLICLLFLVNFRGSKFMRTIWQTFTGLFLFCNDPNARLFLGKSIGSCLNFAHINISSHLLVEWWWAWYLDWSFNSGSLTFVSRCWMNFPLCSYHARVASYVMKALTMVWWSPICICGTINWGSTGYPLSRITIT
jgi:hypothetical protein